MKYEGQYNLSASQGHLATSMMAGTASEKRAPQRPMTPRSSRLGTREIDSRPASRPVAAGGSSVDGVSRPSNTTPRSLPRKLEKRGLTKSLPAPGRRRSHTTDPSDRTRALQQITKSLIDAIAEDPTAVRGMFELPVSIASNRSPDPSEPVVLLPSTMTDQIAATSRLGDYPSRAKQASRGQENEPPDRGIQLAASAPYYYHKNSAPGRAGKQPSGDGQMPLKSLDSGSVTSSQPRKRKLEDAAAGTSANQSQRQPGSMLDTQKLIGSTADSSSSFGERRKRRVNSIARHFDGMSEGSTISLSRVRRSPPKLRRKGEPVSGPQEA